MNASTRIDEANNTIENIVPYNRYGDEIIRRIPSNMGNLICETIMRESAVENQKHRAKSTKQQYGPKVKEFQSWCDKLFSNEPTRSRYLVTEEKLVSFLQMEIIGRKKRNIKSDENGEQNEVGISTVKAYKNAIVDFYQLQRSEKTNGYSHPGEGKTIKNLMQMLKRDTANHRRRNFADRGRSSYRMKALTSKELHQINCYHWSYKNIHNGLRDDMAQFIMRSMAIRGDNMRKMELADLFSDKISNQGVGECVALIAVLDQGKTNQFGKAQFAATLRSKDVLLCAQSKLAFYFFYRFQMSEEGFPDLSSSENWYNIKVYRGNSGNNMTECHYNAHLRAVKKCYKECGFIVNKSTHLMRGDSVRHAEAEGLNRDERRSLGRWEQGSMDQCYSRSLPLDAMRTMAGFSPIYKNYRIPRDLPIPEELLNLVFPEINELEKNELLKEISQRNYTKLQFLEVLKYFRKLIIQDAAMLKEKFSTHWIWRHEIFHNPLFKEFEKRIKEVVNNISQQQEESLEEKLPSIMQDFNGKLKTLIETTEELKTMSRSGWETMYQKLKRCKVVANLVFDENRNNYNDSNKSETLSTEEDHSDKPLFRMDRSVTSAQRLWKEWHEGLHGNESVESIERKYKNAWRKDARDRMFFMKRKNIIDLVKKVSKYKGKSNNEIIEEIDQYMSEEKKTLNWIGTHTQNVFTSLT